METPERYQYYARQCTRWANKSTNDKVRRVLLEVAQVWTQRAVNAQTALANDADSPTGAPIGLPVLAFLRRRYRKLKLRLPLLRRR